MTNDLIEMNVARAIAQSIRDQDCIDAPLPPDWDGKESYIDQGEVDFITVAREAIAALRAGAGVFETCARCDGSGLALNGIGEPGLCPECRGNTVVRSALSQPAQSEPLKKLPAAFIVRLADGTVATFQDEMLAAGYADANSVEYHGLYERTGVEQPAQSRNDVIEAVTQAAIANMPAEFQGEIGAGDLDRMVQAIITAHDSIWERRASAMAEHHRQAVAALKDGGRTNG